MASFEENIQTFTSTIYGTEMRKALYECFNSLYVEIENETKKIRELKSKVDRIEGGN